MIELLPAIFSVFAIIVFLAIKHAAIQKKKIKDDGYHTWAIVVEYKSEFVHVAGTWTWLPYPQVDYITEKGNLQRCRLKYASSERQLLYIGEEVEVILYKDVLYYKPVLTEDFWSHIKRLLW
jgi:hypothetical protein